jgi:hypothetical protein
MKYSAIFAKIRGLMETWYRNIKTVVMKSEKSNVTISNVTPDNDKSVRKVSGTPSNKYTCYWDCVAVTITRLCAGRYGVPIPADIRSFSLLSNVQTRLGSHPASRPMGIRVSSRW